MAPLLQSLKLFSTPAMVAQEPSGVERLKVQTGDCQPYTASSLWLQCLVPRPKKRCAQWQSDIGVGDKELIHWALVNNSNSVGYYFG